MADVAALLEELARSCRELEQIKADQMKDHERACESFEETLLAILRQEQSVLSRVEEEHGRLRDRLSSLQQSNTLALQDGVREINTLVQKISGVSLQLKQLLRSSGQNRPTVQEIQRQISELFLRKNKLRISLKEVHFTPSPPPPTTLGDITCEEHPLGFCTPNLNRKAPSPLLSDEKPPWRAKSVKPEEFGRVGVKILMEDDGQSSSGSSRSFPEMDGGGSAELRVPQRGEVTREVDGAALSTQQATEKWVSDIKQPTNRLLRQQPIRIQSRAGAGKKKGVGQWGRTMATSPELETGNTARQDQTDDRATLYRATAAYIQEDQSESSEDTIEEDLQPMRARQAALRDSRVPSAKKQGNADQWTPPTSDLQRDLPQPPGVDYLRMSDEKSGDSLSVPRAASPADSMTSTYTFIIDKPKSAEISRSGTFRVTTGESGHPVISAKPRLASKSETQPPQAVPRSSSMPYIPRQRRPASAKERRDSASSTSSSWSNSRSASASDQSGALQQVKSRIKSAQYNRKIGKRSREAERCLSERDLSRSPPERGTLVRQFGKFGCGRAELNLPHGVDIGGTGSLYIVDYGNKRLQVMDARGKLLQQFALQAKNYFDVAVSHRGLVALTNSTDRSVDVYSKHGRLLAVISRSWGAPRGITANHRGEFIVADMKAGVLCALILDPTSGRHTHTTLLPGFNKPYLVNCNSQGLTAVTERGPDGGCCVKLLREDWQLLKVLGLKIGPGPPLSNPWGMCVDSEGGVMVADWGQQHAIVYYPANGPAAVLVGEGLSCPRGVALWHDTLLLVADSMNNCIKAYRYRQSPAYIHRG